MQKKIFFLLFVPLVICAQDNSFVLWNDSSSFLYYQNNIIQLRDLNNEILRTYHFNSDIHKDDIFSLVNNNHYTFFDKNKVINIVSKSGGMYYKSLGDTISRIDNSFDHKMTNFSDIFERNDTIFKYGGYGYWSNRNLITYFDKETKEWEFYKINPPQTPPSLSNFSSSIVGDYYYVYGGNGIDPFSGSSYLRNTNVWLFDFESRAWTNLGISNIPYFNKRNFVNIKPDLKLIFTDNENPATLYISFDDNQIKAYKQNKTSFELGSDRSFFVGDTLYNFNHNDQLIFTNINGIFDLANPIKKSPIYVNTNVLYNGLTKTAFISVTLIIILIVFLKYKRNQRPRISDFGIRYKGISYSLKSKEKIILSLVLSKKEVSSQQMFDAVEDKSLSYPQNNKIKNDTIKKLNHKISKILEVDDFIESKKLESDGRVLIYYTQHAHLFVINNKN